MNRLAIEGGTPVRKNKIFYGHQWIDEDDIQAVVDVLRDDYLTCGPFVKKMEQDLLLQQVQTAYCIVVQKLCLRILIKIHIILIQTV